MPSSMTHTYFSMDVYKCLNKTCENKIKDTLEYYKLFCQGSDPFMFYNFFIGNKASIVNKLQYIMHTTKTRALFISIINYINDNKLNNNSSIMSYLYGYICHYFLDLYIHPFIYYKGGKFIRNNKNTYKYNGLHQRLEYGIDLYLIKKRENINPSKFMIYKEIFNISILNKELKSILSNTIGKVYNIDNIDYIYGKSIKDMKHFFRVFNYDPYGVKLRMYKLIDKITPSSIIKVSSLSYSNKFDDIPNYLNLKNKIWYCPWDKDISYKDSFFDLYNKALDKSVRTIEEVTNMLDNGIIVKDRLEYLFKDLSLATGIECDKEINLKYFEF